MVYGGGMKFQRFAQVGQQFPEEGQAQKIANPGHTIRTIQT